MSNFELDRKVTSNIIAEARKYGCTAVTAVQSRSDFADCNDALEPAYREWMHRLNDGERLPRGQAFRAISKNKA